MDHRGRVQAQGGNVNLSSAWSQNSPYVFCDLRVGLNNILTKLSANERTLRNDAVNNIYQYCQNIKNGGGFCCNGTPLMKSFMVKNDPHRRMDLEIIKGCAMVCIKSHSDPCCDI